METVVVDVQYFADYYYYYHLYNHSHAMLEAYELHHKRSFNNRCTIAGANGPILLSVPLVKGRDQKTILKDIRINYAERWQQRHWKSLMSCYNASPWFSYYYDSLSEVFIKRFDFLLDWNLHCLEWSIQQLPFPITYALTGAYQVYYNESEGFRDRRNPGNQVPGTPGNPTPAYQQPFRDRTGFIAGLSILDLLFCEGPNGVVAYFGRIKATL